MARLEDLYQTETAVVISAGDKTVPVVVRKINDVQKEHARRRANAKQALLRRAKNLHDSEEFLEQLNQVQDLFADNREHLVSVIADEHVRQETPMVEARVIFGEGSEWAEDDYLQSLNELWANEMQDRWVRDPDDEEAAKVKDELERYLLQVENELDEMRVRVSDEWASVNVDQLQSKVAEILLERRASAVWGQEFIAARTFYSVRNADNSKELYFETIDDVLGLDERVLNPLTEAYEKISVDPVEGKDLPPDPNFSPQQESDVQADTGTSGLATASV